MSWASPNARKGPALGEGWNEAQREDLQRALTDATFLRHPRATTVWALRVNVSGSLEFLASQADRGFDVVATLTAAGAWTTAGAQVPAAGLADPGR